MRRSASEPHFSLTPGHLTSDNFLEVGPNPVVQTCGDDKLHSPEGGGLEVYMCYRSLRPVSAGAFERLPPAIKARLRDLGVCHYMAIFRSPTGELFQFDFGPRGGDIAKRIPLVGSRRGGLDSCKTASISEIFDDPSVVIYAGARGEIREERVLGPLPETAMFVGRTRLTLNDIRSFNNIQNKDYVLNNNDCRHYVDLLVKYTTGLNRASANLMRYTVKRQRELARRPSPLGKLTDRLAELGQLALEKENTALIARTYQTTMLAAVTTTGFRMLARKGGALQQLALVAGIRPGPAALFTAASAMVSQRRFPELAVRVHDTLRWSRHLATYVFSAGPPAVETLPGQRDGAVLTSLRSASRGDGSGNLCPREETAAPPASARTLPMKRPGILLLAKAARPFFSPAAIGSTARSGVLAGATSALLCARAARRAVDRIALRKRGDGSGVGRNGRIMLVGSKVLQGADQNMQMGGGKDDGNGRKPGKVSGRWGKSRDYGNLALSLNVMP